VWNAQSQNSTALACAAIAYFLIGPASTTAVSLFFQGSLIVNAFVPSLPIDSCLFE
jgi:hypothetical protein